MTDLAKRAECSNEIKAAVSQHALDCKLREQVIVLHEKHNSNREDLGGLGTQQRLTEKDVKSVSDELKEVVLSSKECLETIMKASHKMEQASAAAQSGLEAAENRALAIEAAQEKFFAAHELVHKAGKKKFIGICVLTGVIYAFLLAEHGFDFMKFAVGAVFKVV